MISLLYMYFPLWSWVRTKNTGPGKDTPEGFFKVWNQKKYQKMVILSFLNLKNRHFCLMHKGVAQKLSLTRPFENKTSCLKKASFIQILNLLNFNKQDIWKFLFLSIYWCSLPWICCYISVWSLLLWKFLRNKFLRVLMED